MGEFQLSDTVLEIGRKLHPRRYRRFKDLRSSEEASEWARALDWRNNPYDRFLLRREMLHYLESTEFYAGRRNIYTFASRSEIATEVDHLISEFPANYESIGVLDYVLMVLPWRLVTTHGIVRYSPLVAALTGTMQGSASAD